MKKNNHSFIFTPANEKMLGKIGQSDADAYIIDLEDSIKDSEKDHALTLVSNWLDSHSSKDYDLYVRLNKPRYHIEISQLRKYSVGFMLPKFEDPKEYIDGVDDWNNHEVISLVETPRGVFLSSLIASCPWVDSIAFGAEDFTAVMNMLNRNELLVGVKQTLLIAAKMFGKRIYDTPSFAINDDNQFLMDVDYSVNLGFDGKLAIHPKQIPTINKEFSGNDVDYLRSIVEKYECDSKGAVVIDGKVYEKMHIERMKRIIRENT